MEERRGKKEYRISSSEEKEKKQGQKNSRTSYPFYSSARKEKGREKKKGVAMYGKES